MKHTLSFMVWAILAILLPLQMAQAAAPPTELQKRLQNLPDISDIKPMQSDAYPEKYVFFINQLLDPHHPEAGNFKQRVILSHVGFDRPTVLVTEAMPPIMPPIRVIKKSYPNYSTPIWYSWNTVILVSPCRSPVTGIISRLKIHCMICIM